MNVKVLLKYALLGHHQEQQEEGDLHVRIKHILNLLLKIEVQEIESGRTNCC
jgi:hypothetical protein